MSSKKKRTPPGDYSAFMGCTSKDPYVSERIAKLRAEQIGQKRDVKLWAYRCKNCKNWHLSSSELGKPKRRQRALREARP